MKKFDIEITLTFSKLMASLILILGFIASLILINATLFLSAMAISGGILTGKQFLDKEKIKLKENFSKKTL